MHRESLPYNTVAALQAATSLIPPGSSVTTRGYYAVGDGGENTYYYDKTSSATVDGGFVLNGPGGVGRFIADDQTEINLLKWGVIPDDSATGTANANTVIVEAARNAASTIYCPTKKGAASTTYYLGDPVVMQPDEKWYGDGKRKSVLAFNTYTGSCFVMAKGALIESLTVNGVSAGSGMTGIAVDLTQCYSSGTAGNCARMTLRDVQVTSCAIGILLRDTFALKCYNVTISGCTSGVDVPSAGSYVNDIDFIGGEITTCTTAVNVAGILHRCTFQGVTIQGNTSNGVYVGPYNAAKRASALCFRDCWFESNGTYDVFCEGITDLLTLEQNSFNTTTNCIVLGGGGGANVRTRIDRNRYTYSAVPTAARIVLGSNAQNTQIVRGYNVSDSGKPENVTDGGKWTTYVTGRGVNREVNVVEDYLAAGDGTTDDTTAIQNALNAVAVGGRVFLPQGTFRVTGLTLSKPAQVFGEGVLLIGVNEYALKIDMTSYWGSLKSIGTIADYNLSSAGGKTQVVSQLTITTHGYVVGDVLKISKDAKYGLITDDWVGEMVRVVKVLDADNVVVNRNVEDIAAGAQTNCDCRRVPDGRVSVDLKIDAVPALGSTARTVSTALVELLGAVNPDINVTVSKAYTRCVQAQSVWGGTINLRCVENDTATDVATNTLSKYDYGVVVGGGSSGVRVSMNVSGVRHGFTTRDFTAAGTYDTSLARMQQVGACRDVLVHNSVVSSAYLAAFDTHVLARRIVFQNCLAIYPTLVDASYTALPTAFQDRSQDTQFIACRSVNARIGWTFQAGNYWSKSTTVMMNCSDVGGTERALSCVPTSVNDTTLISTNHVSLSSCMFLDVKNARAIIKGPVWRRDTTYTASPVQIGDGSTVYATGITDLAGASATHAFDVVASATATLVVRQYYVEKMVDATPYGLLSAGSGATLTANVDDASYESFPAEGIVRSASAGTINFVSDGWRGLGQRVYYKSSIPVSGGHRVGDICWNSAPAAAGTMGWVCTAAGTPGTWKTFATIES